MSPQIYIFTKRDLIFPLLTVDIYPILSLQYPISELRTNNGTPPLMFKVHLCERGLSLHKKDFETHMRSSANLINNHTFMLDVML
jgi:hypothetical protein